MNFLTEKPVIYICNIKEEEINDPDANSHFVKVKEYAAKEGSEVVIKEQEPAPVGEWLKELLN